MAQLPADNLYLAGLVPGLFMIVLVAAYGIHVGFRIDDERLPFPMKEALRAIWAAKWELSLPLLVIALFVSRFATIVEAVLRGGKLELLKVTPEARAKDVVNWLGKQPAYQPPPLPLSRGKQVTVSSQFDQPGYDALSTALLTDTAFAQQPLPGANLLQQGAGQLNVEGAVRLARVLVAEELPYGEASQVPPEQPHRRLAGGLEPGSHLGPRSGPRIRGARSRSGSLRPGTDLGHSAGGLQRRRPPGLRGLSPTAWWR